jgi:hypothetical protein
MPLFELAVDKRTPPKNVCPAHKRLSIRHICRYRWEICDAFVGSIKDLGEFYSQPLGSDVVSHHGDNAWVATVNPLLALLLLSFSPAPRGIWFPIMARAYTSPASTDPPPAPTATTAFHPANTRHVGSSREGEEPLAWVHRAFNCFRESDVVRDFLNETCGPSEPLTTPELCLDQDGIEKGATICEDCPGDATAYARGE